MLAKSNPSITKTRPTREKPFFLPPPDSPNATTRVEPNFLPGVQMSSVREGPRKPSYARSWSAIDCCAVDRLNMEPGRHPEFT
jgi:hypothetical protein